MTSLEAAIIRYYFVLTIIGYENRVVVKVQRLYDLKVLPICSELLLLHIDHGIVLSVRLGVERGLVLEAVRCFLALLVDECKFVYILWAEAEFDDYNLIYFLLSYFYRSFAKPARASKDTR